MYFYQLDQLGTPLSLTDSENNIVWQAHYSVFGKASVTINEIDNPIRFQGQYYDSESGLHYNHFRYYDPQTGRFISQDPIGLLGGINHYQYAPNHVNWIDPLGLSCKERDDKKGAVFAGHGSVDMNKTTVVPEGTSITFFSKDGAVITDDLGVAIENWEPLENAYSRTFKSGETIPMYCLYPNCGALNIQPSSTQVSEPTSIDMLLKPDMGNCRWAACTFDEGHENAELIFHTDGVYKKVNGEYFVEVDGKWIKA